MKAEPDSTSEHTGWHGPKAPVTIPRVVKGTRNDAFSHHDGTGEFSRDVLSGLLRKAKSLPSKYFYDERGSQLFDEICELDEYYPTRTEVGILRAHAGEMATMLGRNVQLVELGSGSSTKTRLLLDALSGPAQYVPVDISREHLEKSANKLARDYPGLQICPVAADYTKRFALPECDRSMRAAAYFPGSTVGNFAPGEACDFLARLSTMVTRGAGPRGALLIGVDLKKDPQLLHAAYNDRAGVTAQFNLNVLARINRELGADFVLPRFRHYAFYNAPLGRVEMHLVSAARQRVTIAGRTIAFDDGESIHTECSYKYTVREFSILAAQAGFALEKVWTDGDNLFSVQYYTARS